MRYATHLVYRTFDDYGLLLYIGCTHDLTKRLKAHESRSPWFRFMSTIGAGEKRNEFEAFALEREAIESEASYFNSTLTDQANASRNLHAANRALRGIGLPRPDVFDESMDEAYDYWHSRRAQMRVEIRDRYPFMDPALRMSRYLAARGDAELARQEPAA